ncbi:hypothetical protein QCA50_014796 [Cerrena zonata]|uniref:Uncharacterized protein n=1 Tax=Cerrena zonata TaxID=2478898 RepID=A0AAW0FVA5_9APHY
MHYLFLFISLILAAAPVAVVACEGECIVGITNAFLGNYTNPIRVTMEQIAQQISYSIPNQPPPFKTINYLQPILDAYNNGAYDGMENAIFPSYFHGKCLRGGVTPPGCPNPDCDVVCGTPGSLVHFYPKLRYIAFDQTRRGLQALSAPGADAYNQLEQAVLDSVHQGSNSRRDGRLSRYGLSYARRSDDDDVRSQLRSIMDDLPNIMERVCGGTGSGSTNGLPDCSWTSPMKEYILTFP